MLIIRLARMRYWCVGSEIILISRPICIAVNRFLVKSPLPALGWRIRHCARTRTAIVSFHRAHLAVRATRTLSFRIRYHCTAGNINQGVARCRDKFVSCSRPYARARGRQWKGKGLNGTSFAFAICIHVIPDFSESFFARETARWVSWQYLYVTQARE